MQESICSRAAHEGGLTPSDLQRLVDVARAAADAGGQELMRHYGRLSTIESKGRIGDLVTNAITVCSLASVRCPWGHRRALQRDVLGHRESSVLQRQPAAGHSCDRLRTLP